MRHAAVLRLALALAGLLAAASLLFAWHRASRGAGAGSERAGGAPEEGPDALFARHCGACHDRAELAAGLREAPDPARAVLELLDLLDGHGSADGGEDRALAAWLLEGAGEGR